LKVLLISVLALSFIAGPSLAETSTKLPVDVVNGQKVEVRGASAERDEKGLIARGWVRRKLGAYGPISAHLHVDGLDDKGATVELVNIGWSGSLGTRPPTPKVFKAKFDPLGAGQIERVRISVQPGRTHDEGK